VIKEGFICAECHDQFNSVEILLSHYQQAHPANEDSKTIKGLIEKAKSRLVNKQDPEVLRFPAKYYDLYEDCTLGKSFSHYDYFKRIRSAQVERCSSEANRLLIRLQKIMNFEGDDSKRRVHEQEVVHWVEEKLVSRCPDCAQQFNLLQRKHHCRLCGSILCDDCSIALPSDVATTLVLQMGATLSATSRSNGSSSSPSVQSSTTKSQSEYKIRTCNYCYTLVMKKHTSFTNSSSKAIVTQFYERLRALMSQCEARNSEYNTIVSSLNQGDKLYSIEQCTATRNELIKLTEKIDILSKRINLLGVESGEEISESEKRLRARIRTGTINWIREFLASIKLLPTEKPQASAASGPVVKIVDGWTPSQGNVGNSVNETDDVMEIQITNMKRWIDEARGAGKHDEVEMLEANLSELLQFRYNASK